MGSFIVNVTNGSETGTITPDVGFRYTDNLNELNEADIKISGTGSVRRGLLVIGANVEIKRNDTREFYGFIDMIDYLTAGTVVFHASGYEKWLALENGSYASSPYKATASATIAGDLIGESNYLTAGTVETGFDTDFRISTSESLYNALSNLARKTTQDIGIDYVNLEVDVLDHKGSSSVVSTFNKGIDIGNVRVTHGYPSGNKIKVFGKGDGDNQITATSSDGTSIAAYGEVTRTVIDRSIMSSGEAGKLADAELALTKDPTKIYDFGIINSNESLISGDHLYLNAPDLDLSNEEVRVVGIERGMRGKTEYLTAQVTNPAYKSLMKTRNKILAGVDKSIRDNTSYMQGSGNLSQWAGIINGNNSAGLKINFNVGDRFEDEAGNLRVKSLTLDYDIDPYRREVGTASESNKEPDIASGTYSSSDNESTEVDEDTTFNNSITFDDSWTSYKSWTNILQHGQAIIFHVQVWVVDWNNPTSAASVYARIKHVDDTDYYPSTTGIRLCRGITEEDTDNDTHDHSGTTSEDTHSHGYNAGTYDRVRVYNAAEDYGYVSATETDAHTHTFTTDEDTHDHKTYNQLNGSGTIYIPIDPYLQDFDVELDHTDSGNATAGVFFAYYVVSQHKHGSGDYKTDLHKHDVSVGDAVSDAGSINATNTTLYLEYWNTGTSAWDTKVTITPSPAKTLDTDVDMTDSGTYPDAKGWWRMRILTNNASPDLIQGIASIRHELDSS